MAIKVGKPVARKVIQFENEYVVSECPLAGTHIQQGVNKIDNSKNVKVCHTLEVLAKSMSISKGEIMKKFNIKEDDVINIDKYINERPKIKKEISEIKKFRRIPVGPYATFILSVMTQ